MVLYTKYPGTRKIHEKSSLRVREKRGLNSTGVTHTLWLFVWGTERPHIQNIWGTMGHSERDLARSRCLFWYC